MSGRIHALIDKRFTHLAFDSVAFSNSIRHTAWRTAIKEIYVGVTSSVGVVKKV